MFPSEYAGTAQKHERGVYLREADITAALDSWLLGVFDPENFDGSVEHSPQRGRDRALLGSQRNVM